MADIQINVMIFGGRRCGKTSVLTTMQSCFNREFGESNLTIVTANNSTLYTLEKKYSEIEDYFKNNCRKFIPDANPPAVLSKYEFRIGLRNRRTDEIIVNFIEYPIVWIDEDEKADELTKIMKSNHVIIIAIDSPYLMEMPPDRDPNSVGRYNEQVNYCFTIDDWVRQFFTKEGNSAKMVLFVPLKCEKYYHKNRMDELKEKVKVAYSEVIKFFIDNNDAYEVAITPILTLGGEKDGVEFSDFNRDEEGYIIEHSKSGIPPQAIYKFTKKMDRPEPLHCEQPIIYILAYVLTSYILQQHKNFIFKNPSDNFALEDFLRELNNISNKIKRYGNGYEIVCNPLNF